MWGCTLTPYSDIVPDMDQLYERWLQSQKPGWSEDTSNNSVRENGKQIHMPTDYAEEVVSRHFHISLIWTDLTKAASPEGLICVS